MANRICLLDDGRLVGIRTVNRTDHAGLAALYRSVSVESRRARFHGTAVPSDDYIRTLAGLSRSGEGAAVIAVAMPGDHVVAVAECRIDHALPVPTAHVGMLVHDDYQGVALGGQLWSALVAEARQLGIERLQVDVEAGNRRMLRLVARHGASREPETRGAHVHLLVDTAPVPAEPASNQPRARLDRDADRSMPSRDDERRRQRRIVPNAESRSIGVEHSP